LPVSIYPRKNEGKRQKLHYLLPEKMRGKGFSSTAGPEKMRGKGYPLLNPTPKK